MPSKNNNNNNPSTYYVDWLSESKKGRHALNFRERKMFFRIEATTETFCSPVFVVHRNGVKLLVENDKENDRDTERQMLPNSQAHHLYCVFMVGSHMNIVLAAFLDFKINPFLLAVASYLLLKQMFFCQAIIYFVMFVMLSL